MAKFFILLISVTASLIATQQKQQMLKELDAISLLVDTRYAPKEYKQRLINVSIKREFQQAKELIEALDRPEIYHYRKIVTALFAKLQDPHVSISYIANECSFIPLETLLIQRRCFAQDSFDAIEKGDEILSIDGVPILDVIRKIARQKYGSARNKTHLSLAQNLLFWRHASLGIDCPSGLCTLLCRRNDRFFLAEIPWEHTHETITIPEYTRQAFNRLWINPLQWYKLQHEDDLEISKSQIPPLGGIVSDESGYYQAYIWEHPEGKNVGYLYLDSFLPPEDELEMRLDWLKLVLQTFKDTTEAVVIDITNNPGGSITYLYQILSYLADDPLITPWERETLTPRDVALLQGLQDNPLSELLNATNSDPNFNSNNISRYAEHLLDCWKRGLRLSDPHPILGIQKIYPSQEFNTRLPIVVLVNELSGSCGDLFAAILQDSRRATIFGTKTAGAGGAVSSWRLESPLGTHMIRLTTSMAIRPSLLAIENLGVTPDILQEITLRDLTNDYCDYKERLYRVLSRIFPKESQEEPLPTEDDHLETEQDEELPPPFDETDEQALVLSHLSSLSSRQQTRG